MYFQKVQAPPHSESNGCPLKEKNIVLAVHESIFSWKAETLHIFSDVIVICDDLMLTGSRQSINLSFVTFFWITHVIKRIWNEISFQDIIPYKIKLISYPL